MKAATPARQSATPARKSRPQATVAVGFVHGMLSGLAGGGGAHMNADSVGSGPSPLWQRGAGGDFRASSPARALQNPPCSPFCKGGDEAAAAASSGVGCAEPHHGGAGPIDYSRLLAAAGIAPEVLADPAARVPLERYATLYNGVVASLDDEGFGLFSQPLRRGTFEFLCRACLGAGDLGEALDRAARYLRVVLPDLAVGLERERGAARLWIAARPSLPGDGAADPRRVFAFEWLLRLVHGLASWLVGRGIVLDRVDFPFPPPPHAADYALIYTEDSRFDAGERLTASLAANLLELPVRRDEAALAAFLDGMPGKITTLYRRDRDMVLRVRDTLRAALPELPDLAGVAARLHLSQRTLHRRLEEEGSSYRLIKDALRRDLALSRLSKTRASIAEIAAGLGFTDPSAFYRAFVGWTGVSPQQYRQRLGDAAAGRAAG